MLQTPEHELKDNLKASGAGHAVDTAEHRLPAQMSTAAGTLQFQQLCGSSVGSVSLEWPSMNVCFFLVPCSKAWLPNFSVLHTTFMVYVALGLTQMLMLYCREDAALCNSFIALLYFSCHGPMCLLHDSGLSNNLWENHALADKTKETKNGKKKKGFGRVVSIACTNQRLLLLQCTLLQGNAWQVGYFKAAIHLLQLFFRKRMRRQSSSSLDLRIGLFWEGLPLQPGKFLALLAAALDMGSADPTCWFPSISHITKPLVRSRNQPLYCNWAFTHLCSVQYPWQWWHGHSKQGLGWRQKHKETQNVWGLKEPLILSTSLPLPGLGHLPFLQATCSNASPPLP